MARQLPEVAVVILSWNGRDFLDRFLPSVLESTYRNMTVYVADNASSDGTVTFLEESFPKINVIALPQNYGFAGGYNKALKQITADYYVLLNQDVEVTPEWIEPVVELMEQDKQIAACQPKLKAYKDKAYFEYAGAAGGFIDKFGFPFCRGRIFDFVEKDEGQYDQRSEIFWATGACCFVKADLFHKIGGLDKDFFAHMEEVDLCWRLKNSGYKVMCQPESVVYHVGGGSLPQGNPKKTYLNFRNNLVLLFKNLPLTKLFYIFPLRLMIDHFAAYYALFRGQWRNYLAIAKAHFSFIIRLPLWIKKRNKNLPMARPNRNGNYRKSIVWQYFIKGTRKFSELAPEDLY